jgi:hypothetical protein
MTMRQVFLGSVGPYLYDDATYDGLTTDGDVVAAGFTPSGLILGTVDPTAGAGIAATIGSLFGRNNSGAGELWLKTGAANTAWTQVSVP